MQVMLDAKKTGVVREEFATNENDTRPGRGPKVASQIHVAVKCSAAVTP